jgi:hypothetical protein
LLQHFTDREAQSKASRFAALGRAPFVVTSGSLQYGRKVLRVVNRLVVNR